ncbi:hypothetical protein EGJ27_13940 [Pseudomonas sp. v388]|nr:hypothetical protein EGJ27_13940 [Pseudomonas sp. v388]
MEGESSVIRARKVFMNGKRGLSQIAGTTTTRQVGSAPTDSATDLERASGLWEGANCFNFPPE